MNSQTNKTLHLERLIYYAAAWTALAALAALEELAALAALAS